MGNSDANKMGKGRREVDGDEFSVADAFVGCCEQERIETRGREKMMWNLCSLVFPPP